LAGLARINARLPHQVVANGQQQLHAQAVDADLVIEVADFELIRADVLQIERTSSRHLADAPWICERQP
jgi:hypothetical protein